MDSVFVNSGRGKIRSSTTSPETATIMDDNNFGLYSCKEQDDGKCRKVRNMIQLTSSRTWSNVQLDFRNGVVAVMESGNNEW